MLVRYFTFGKVGYVYLPTEGDGVPRPVMVAAPGA